MILNFIDLPTLR